MVPHRVYSKVEGPGETTPTAITSAFAFQRTTSVFEAAVAPTAVMATTMPTSSRADSILRVLSKALISVLLASYNHTKNAASEADCIRVALRTSGSILHYDTCSENHLMVQNRETKGSLRLAEHSLTKLHHIRVRSLAASLE
jgi:hypothetical protein